MVDTISFGTPTGTAAMACCGGGVQVPAGCGRDVMAADVGPGEGRVQGANVDEDGLDAGSREPVTQVLVLRAFGIQSADEDNGLLAHRASPIFKGDSPLRRAEPGVAGSRRTPLRRPYSLLGGPRRAQHSRPRDQLFRFFHHGSKVLTRLPGGCNAA